MAAEATQLNEKTERAVDVFAASLKEHIKGDGEWMEQAAEMPVLSEDGEQVNATYLEAAAKLFFVWWRSQQQ